MHGPGEPMEADLIMCCMKAILSPSLPFLSSGASRSTAASWFLTEPICSLTCTRRLTGSGRLSWPGQGRQLGPQSGESAQVNRCTLGSPFTAGQWQKTSLDPYTLDPWVEDGFIGTAPTLPPPTLLASRSFHTLTPPAVPSRLSVLL